MWFCFTIIGFIAALVIIVSLWEKFQTNPTITGLDMDVHNQQLVFPTVVVCPMFPFEPNRTNELAYNYLGCDYKTNNIWFNLIPAFNLSIAEHSTRKTPTLLNHF